jgi:type 1 glutamine amidotransferase
MTLAQAGEPLPNSTKINVLIVDGFSNHDWRHTTQLIRDVLTPTGLFDVAVSTSPATADAPGWDTWRPQFQDYDVVIQNCNDINHGPAWPREVQVAFEDFVRRGGGVYLFHSAQNAFANWPAYNQIIGLGWRNKNYGTAIEIGLDEKLIRIPPGEGQGTGHGPRGEVQVHLLGSHPIHEGLPKVWKTLGLEVYAYARGPAENVQVLSYASDARDGKRWPIEWTVQYGQGRAYLATFGHVWKDELHPESMRCVGVQTIMIRALQWLARRPVTYPIPTNFPTETSSSLLP